MPIDFSLSVVSPQAHRWSYRACRRSIPALLLAIVAACSQAQLPAQDAAATKDPATTQAASPQSATGPARLRLKSGDFVEGQLEPGQGAGMLGWTNPFFREPLQFALTAVRSIDAPAGAAPRVPQAAWSFEWTDGDRMWGDWIAIGPQGWTVRHRLLGDLTIPPERLRRAQRMETGEVLVYQGPSSIEGWKVLDESLPWVMESGSLVSKDHGSKVRGLVGLPPRAQIDVRLSWDRQPNFVLSLGVTEEQTSAGKAFGIEVWDDKLALVRDIGGKADASYLETLDRKRNDAELSIFLDQPAGRATVFSAKGKRLAEIVLPTEAAEVGTAILLENYGRQLRLEHLRIQKWNQTLPSEQDREQNYVVDRSGKTTPGSILEAQASSPVVVAAKDGSQTASMAWEELSEVVVQRDAQPPTEPTEVGDWVQLELIDQSRWSGRWLGCDAEAIVLKSPGIDQPLRIPRSALLTLRGSETPYQPAKAVGKEGLLLLPGVQLYGSLLNTPENLPGALLWQPTDSPQPLILASSASGRIDYRKSEKWTPPSPTPGRVVTPGGASSVPSPRRATVPNLTLRDGQLISIRSVAVDEQGVRFDAAVAGMANVPQAQVQSIELRRIRKDRTPATAKMARLLTIPRARKNDPPSHLIASVDGDYLRGRLVSMDDKEAVVEVRGEPVRIAMEKIAQIVWLHDRPWMEDATQKTQPTLAAGSADRPRVHAVERSGWRLTMDAGGVSDGTLSGTSPWLGACEVSLASVELLLIGNDVDLVAKDLTENPWKLSLAPPPRTAEADGDSTDGREPGKGSALIGRPAPPIQLDTLDGQTFQLDKLRGKVVVLDFWASWCGPCMKTMPQVDEIIAEFPADQVELVAVNLEEPADRAQAAMERLKLKTRVALDLDGVAARNYQASAIPQTVVIDRQGIVQYLFVGGGPTFLKQFRESLQRVVDEKGSEVPAP